MVQNDSTTPPPAADDKAREQKQKVAEYLQAPRRKRKSYVVLALSRSAQQSHLAGMEGFLRSQFKQMAIATPRTPDELQKLFSRQIMLLVFDDEFVDLEQGLSMVRDLKQRRSGQAVPVLFLTRQPERLIELYNRYLLPYQEADDYINYAKVDMNYVYSKMRAGLASENRRRSRRYQVDMPVEYFLLADDKLHPGRIIDMSIHGAMLKAEDNRIFRPSDQLKLHLPAGTYLSGHDGDFFKISAKVRRVFIGGSQSGISFEYLSERQTLHLTEFVTELVNNQAVRRTQAARSRGAR